jgi:hypothetical protein
MPLPGGNGTMKRTVFCGQAADVVCAEAGCAGATAKRAPASNVKLICVKRTITFS